MIMGYVQCMTRKKKIPCTIGYKVPIHITWCFFQSNPAVSIPHFACWIKNTVGWNKVYKIIVVSKRIFQG